MNRILIIKPSALGDIATTLPLLCDVRRAHPTAHIDWLIHPGLLSLLLGHDAINDLVAFDRKNLKSWWYKPSAFKLFKTLLKTLRQNNYDTVIDAQGLFRSAYFARHTKAATRIGFAHAREGAPLAYTHKIELPEDGAKMLAVDRMRALGKPLNTDTSAPAEFRLPVQLAAIHSVEQKLPRRYAALIPGARWDTKRWAAEGYIQIARRLADAALTPVLLGSPDEKPLCDRIAATLASPAWRSTIQPINLAGQTSLADMIAVLARAQLVIGNDSGPLHVAVALGKRCVSIYGPTSPAFVGPYNQLDRVLRHDVPCHPCRLRECDHHSCMAGVTVEAVWEKTTKLVERT